MNKTLKDGTCPKCGSSDVYYTDNQILQVLPTTYLGLDKPGVDNYACGTCGYAEFYITAGTLHLVNERWTRVDNIAHASDD